jgi:hypothetical protein
MIEVSVTPGRLVVGRPAQLEIRFANAGGGPCANIAFTLGLPSGLRLVGGRGRVAVAAIAAGRDFAQTMTVVADKAGDFTLTSSNFSYRNEVGRPVRVSDWSAPISAEEPRREPPRVARPAPRLRLDQVEHEGPPLAVNEWGVLEVLVTNPSDAPVLDVAVAIDGPFEAHRRSFPVPELDSGRAVRPRFSLSPNRGGLVPVSVRLTYSYPDGLGSLRRASLEEQLSVPVGGPGATADGRGAKRARTILFLAASPSDWEPIRPDRELKKIREQLRLDQGGGDLTLVDDVAVRLHDINPALLRHTPDVVHFSGHGDEEGRLYVEDEDGYGRPTNIEGMAEQFGSHKTTIRCVVVNACHSARLAQAISGHIDYAVGMNASIGDRVSISFSVAFYQTYFATDNVPFAFEVARSVLHSDEATAHGYQTPVLYPPGPGFA